jgi:Holliday junction resolvase RusA-like endonuclease
VASPEYRTAKCDATAWLKGLWLSRPKLGGEMVLHARCYFPDKRKRDAGNYRKLITDVMSSVVYTDDSQLISETWERAGFDKVSPRIEITLRSA